MNEIDEVLFSHSPAVMVPRFGKLSTPEGSGHRYLVASTGVFLHVYRPWLNDMAWSVDGGDERKFRRTAEAKACVRAAARSSGTLSASQSLIGIDDHGGSCFGQFIQEPFSVHE